MSVINSLMDFDTPDAPFIEKEGLRYIWQENIIVDNDSVFDQRKGGLRYSFLNAKGEGGITVFRQGIAGAPYFPFDCTGDMSADDSDLQNVVGVYALEGTF